MALARRGVRLELVPNADGLPDEARMLRMLDEVPGVRVLTVSWVQFSTGHRADLATLGRACRERGVYFVVDGIQGLGAATLDVRACHVDVFACGAQKWLLSPWGTAFAYVRRELAETLEPSPVGWMAVRGSDDFSRLVDYDLTWHPDARRFEMFTLPFQDFAAANASLALFEELGPANVARRIAALASRIVRWADGRAGVRLVTPSDPARRAGVVSVAPADPAAAAERLALANVQCSLREGAIRLSPHCYNTEAEVDRALEALEG
jgi:selenocysteine lyase/cysteine desulfurase